MEFSSYRNRSYQNGQGLNLKAILNFSDISDATQKHLTQVYTLLLVCTMVCALGMYVNKTLIVSGFFMDVVAYGLMIYLMIQVLNRKKSQEWRMGCLAGVAFQLGCMIGPAIHMIMGFYTDIILQAVLYTATTFNGFTLISLYSKRRSFLFLGGIAASLLQALVMYRLFGWLFGWTTINMTYVMSALFVDCLYIIYDTQLIVERSELGDKDVVAHTLTLFVDLFDLFVHMVQILILLKEKGEQEKKKKKQRDRK